jgi:hypothetical protein
MTQTTTYFLTYTVLADSRLAALMKAGAMLRTNVRMVGQAEAEQGVPGWWDVTFLVAEEYPDHAPDATFATEGIG